MPELGIVLMRLQEHMYPQHDTAGNNLMSYHYYMQRKLRTVSRVQPGNLQLINFHLRDHGVLGEIRPDLRPAASAEAAGRRAPRGGHNAGRHRCSGSAGRSAPMRG